MFVLICKAMLAFCCSNNIVICLRTARKQCWNKYSTAMTAQAVNTALGTCMTPQKSGTCPPPKPAGAQPAGAQPAGAQPAGAQPAGAQPAGAQPAGAQPAGAQPAGAQPAGAQPAGGQPAGAQPLPRAHMNLSASEQKKGRQSKRAGVIAGATAFAAAAVVAASLLAFFVHRRNGSTPVNGVTQTWRPSKAWFWQNYLLADMSSTEQREQLITYSYTGLSVFLTCFKLHVFCHLLSGVQHLATLVQQLHQKNNLPQSIECFGDTCSKL
jgi:hypothetical protein